MQKKNKIKSPILGESNIINSHYKQELIVGGSKKNLSFPRKFALKFLNPTRSVDKSLFAGVSWV